MTWLRIDDGFAEHPKIVGLSADAFRLHVSALCYCARNLTDGLVSRLALRSVGSNANLSRPGTTARTLCRAGLWAPEGDAYRIHDYLEYNPSKLDVERERAEARERMKRRRSGEQTANRSGERSGEVRGPRPGPLVSDNQNRSEATRRRALTPVARIRQQIRNGAITDTITLEAELRAQGLNGADEQALKADLAAVTASADPGDPSLAGEPEPFPTTDTLREWEAE